MEDASPSATEFRLKSPYIADNVKYFAGRSIGFVGGPLDKRVANVVKYGQESGNGQLTVRGLSSAPATGQQFHILGAPVACYRPGDAGSAGWELRRLRLSAAETSYRTGAYVPTGTPTLRVEGGAGYNDHVLAAGWQTVESRLPKSKMTADAYGRFCG
ncbi:MAG: hypothetical protein DCC67_06795 [Planctomycetota bacterium]|nr:MAG: hypothetical protein DCC67_06795 [Planctomycetota bacterium]